MGAYDGRHVLVVEDERDVACLLQERLSHLGYQVHIEETGHLALAYATQYHPDLIVLDLLLPDTSGELVCKALRKIYFPWGGFVLMLTAKDQPVDKLRGFAFGADAYMTKPYEFRELANTIRLLLQGDGSASPEWARWT